MFVRIAIACFWIALLGLGAGAAPHGLQPLEAPGVAPSDTIDAALAEGRVLTTLLPASLGDTPVARYRLVDGPPFSGVAQRSLTWPAANAEPGTYHLVLVPATESPTDTLVVRVRVEGDT